MKKINIPEYIVVKGAKLNNLKNVDLKIPRNKLVVFTGVSGSGKSSLVFDTLYAEGQRRYIESLSSYARQFLDRIEKPKVDYIHGISPAIAIEQKQSTPHPRSTVGTMTEIYDYLRLLFGRIGKTIDNVTGQEVTNQEVDDVIDEIAKLEMNSKLVLFFRHKIEKKIEEELRLALQKGFSRILLNNQLTNIEDLNPKELSGAKHLDIFVDRFKTKKMMSDFKFRVAGSIQTAYHEGNGECFFLLNDEKKLHFSERFEVENREYEKPNLDMFNFNSPYGACQKCQGLGEIMGYDEDLVIPDKTLSIYEGAVACWKGKQMSKYKEKFILKAEQYNFPIHKAYVELSDDQKNLLWNGKSSLMGIYPFFKKMEEGFQKIQNRILVARYRGYSKCPECYGSRIRKDALNVFFQGKNISDFLFMPIDELYDFFENSELNKYEQQVSARILTEIQSRLSYLMQSGLSYLTLNRKSRTLSGGEMQRIQLARLLGSNLTGSLYILDEPTVGLHPRDSENLVNILKKLRNLGNNVLVVEHDELTMESADEIVDMGPKAGENGGEVVFQGTWNDLQTAENSLTAKYLTGKLEVPTPEHVRATTHKIELSGVYHNNLKNVSVTIPLHNFTVVTGVSGSGKTSLIRDVLFPAISKTIGMANKKIGPHKAISGDLEAIKNIEFLGQNAIGRSSRSNPATYTKAYDDIRELFAKQKQAKSNNIKAGNFSFNIEGGRCETCKGEGKITVEMQFLPDVILVCEDCDGKMFKDKVLEIKYKELSIYDVLQLTIQEAIDFFEGNKKLLDKLQPLVDVGLDYLRLGQNTATLSGGEAQRLKLAAFLAQRSGGEGNLYIFDEPSTGLHFEDIRKLMQAFDKLIAKGNTIIVIEHNLDIIKCADWIIDLGPEAGKNGGELVYQGLVRNFIKESDSHTARYLKEKF